MVSQAALISMGLQTFVSFVFPMTLFVYYYRTKSFSLKPVVVGMFVFIIFSQILEKLLHVYVLQTNDYTTQLLSNNPWLFATYGALAAGFFEEIGRYLGFRLLLPRNRARVDGIALGIGHGGIEAILIGVIGGIQSLSFANMLNNGTLGTLLGDKLPAETYNGLVATLIDTPYYMYLLGGFERVVAVMIHIVLSLLVLYSLRRGKSLFLLYAILIHAAIDFLPAMYQAGAIPFEIVEIFLVAVFVCCIVALVKSKTWLAD